MSTYWGYRCNDCDINSDTWFNHGEQKLTEIAEAWRITEALAWQHVRVGTEFGFGGYWFEIEGFLESHGAHDIILRNEYGDTLPLVRRDIIAVLTKRMAGK